MDSHVKGRLVSGRPVRKIGPNSRSITGRLAIHGKSVAYESSLERDFLVIQSFDRAVKSVQEQPVRIEYQDAKGKRRTYTPDFLVETWNTRRTLYEIKYREQLKEEWAQLRPRYRAAVHYAASRWMKFRILTEVELRSTSLLENANFLRSYLEEPPDEGIENLLVRNLLVLGETTPEALLAASFGTLEGRMRAVSSLWRLAARGEVEIDLLRPLTMSSWIGLSEKGEKTWPNRRLFR